MAARGMELHRAARRLGYEVRNGSNHYKIRRGAGAPLVIVPFDGAERMRQFKNSVAHLRRVGYEDLADEVSPRVPKRAGQRTPGRMLPAVG